MDWKEYYKKRLTTPEEAIKVVKAGDYVVFNHGMEPLALGLALINQGVEVGGVRIFIPTPGRDFAWYDTGWENIFQIEVGFVLPIVQQMINDKRGDFRATL